jgi:hypothetical protein
MKFSEKVKNFSKPPISAMGIVKVFRHSLMMSGRRKVAYTSSRVSMISNVGETDEARITQNISAAAQPRETSYANTS